MSDRNLGIRQVIAWRPSCARFGRTKFDAALSELGEVFAPTDAQIVEHQHLLAAGDQLGGETLADKAAAPGDQPTHVSST